VAGNTRILSPLPGILHVNMTSSGASSLGLFLSVQTWAVLRTSYPCVACLLLQDVDGAILVTDPQHPEQEKELEQLYLRIVQPHNLTMKQCCVLAITQGEPNTTGSWSGELERLRTNGSILQLTCSGVSACDTSKN
jgi:hypothetical protein